jgi:hypothetical protein
MPPPIPDLSTECSSVTMKLVIAGRPIYPFHYLGTWTENGTTDGVLRSEMAKCVLEYL